MKTVIVALALSLSICGCNGNPKAADSKQPETSAQTVEVVPVASQKLATVFTLPAQLVPFETVDIYPRVTGFMDMIRVDPGSPVPNGELIIRLSNPGICGSSCQGRKHMWEKCKWASRCRSRFPPIPVRRSMHPLRAFRMTWS